MKRVIRIILSLILLLSLVWVGKPEAALAAPTLSMTTTANSVIIGETVKVTVAVPTGYGATVDIKFDQTLFEYVGASTGEVGTTNISNGYLTVNLTTILNTPSVTVEFKATSSGSAKFQATAVFAANEDTEEEVQMGGASASVTVANKVVQDDPKSDDNSLSALKLSVDGVAISLSPAFKYNVTSYTATVEHNVSKVVVSATKSHEKATIESITSNGNVALKVGTNTIEIVVKAENGYKVTYRITVTRKAQPVSSEDTGSTQKPTESETETEEVVTIEGVDSGWTYNGSSLFYTEKIPTEIIPGGFNKDQMMIKNYEVPCLTLKNSDLTVFYLKNASGSGALYVYDKADDRVYPCIRLATNDRYIIILEPEAEKVVEGYESCSLSIEGKGIVIAYRATSIENPNASDFYLLYTMNNNGEKGWYQYDYAEGTFQRYVGNIFNNFESGDNTEDTQDDTQTGNNSGNNNSELSSDVEDLQLQLKAAEEKLLKLMCIFAFIIVVFVIVIINLLITRKKVEVVEDEAYEEEDLDDEDLEEDIDEDIEDAIDIDTVISAQSEETVETIEDVVEKTVVEEVVVEETEVEPAKEEPVATTIEEDEDQDLEFIDL